MKNTMKISILKYLRITGILFLLSLLIPTLNWLFVLSKFISDTNLNTVQKILDNVFLFRVNIMNEILTSVIILLLGIYLYTLLKSVSKNLSFIALLLKITEAALTVGLGFLHFIFLIALTDNASTYEVQNLIDLLLRNHISLTAIPGIFFGLSLGIFCYILLKSGYIPCKLALFGITSYMLVFIYDSLMLLTPEFAVSPLVQIIGSLPVCLFQITIGIWLLSYGINKKTVKRL